MPRSREILLPWTSQPQEAASLAPWFERRARGYFNFASPSATKYPVSITGSPTSAVGANGISQSGSASDYPVITPYVRWNSGTSDFMCVMAVNNLFGGYAGGDTAISGSAGAYSSGFFITSYYNSVDFKATAVYTGDTIALTGVTKNVPAVIVARRTAAGLNLWVKSAAQIKTGFTSTASARNILSSGNPGLTMAFKANQTQSLAAVFEADGEGEFTDELCESLLDIPWQIFAHQTIPVPVSAGGGGTFIPAWAHRQSRTIGAGVI